MISNHNIIPLDPERCLGADQINENMAHRYGIWLPSGNEAGTVQVDYWGNDSHELDFAEDLPEDSGGIPKPNIYRHTQSLEYFEEHTALGGLLTHLGLEGGSQDGDLISSTKATFPDARVLADTVATLNESLEDWCQFPTFVPYDGPKPDARTFLEAITEDMVLIPSGRGEGATPSMAAGHMTSRIPYWLITPRTLRYRLQDSSYDALSTTPRDAVEPNEFTMTLPTTQEQHRIITGISPLGLNGVIADRFSSWRQVDKMIGGHRDREAALLYMDDVHKRIQYLREQFPPK